MEKKAPAVSSEESGEMSHRDVLQALSGLLMGMFVSILAATVVATSLPLIIAELGGNQSSYTWVVTGTMLATAVSTPLWGKFADLINRKLLLQLALVIFVAGSTTAGFSQDTTLLIGARVLQGAGAGGLASLSQIILADIISPRERGRYSGWFGGVMAVGSVGGPLLGGVVTDAFGWRWNFFVALPVAIIALILLQRTLHLPARPKRKVRIDYFGATLLACGVSLLLIWVSLAGSQFGWASIETAWMTTTGVLLVLAAIIVELNVKEPVIPLTMFKNKTFTLSVVASLAVGVSMFGTAMFLAQYMQLARGASPTVSGLLTIPMMIGVMGSSTTCGQIITRTGKWKPIVILGTSLIIVGSTLLGTLDGDTKMTLVGVYMFILGSGIGMLMQNLVLIVQNTIDISQLGIATSSVTFFRTIGGTIGVSLLGAYLGAIIPGRVIAGIQQLDPADQAEAAKTLSGSAIPKLDELTPAVRNAVEHAYGSAIGNVFFLMVPLATLAFLAVVFLPNHPLGTLTAVQAEKAQSPSTGNNIMNTATDICDLPAVTQPDTDKSQHQR